MNIKYGNGSTSFASITPIWSNDCSSIFHDYATALSMNILLDHKIKILITHGDLPIIWCSHRRITNSTAFDSLPLCVIIRNFLRPECSIFIFRLPVRFQSLSPHSTFLFLFDSYRFENKKKLYKHRLSLTHKVMVESIERMFSNLFVLLYAMKLVLGCSLTMFSNSRLI